MSVAFNGRSAEDFAYEDPQIVRVQVPALDEGWADLTLSVPGQDAVWLEDQLEVRDARLEVHDIGPSEGAASGGTSVVISGFDFTPATEVFFGDRRAARIEWQGPDELIVEAPAGFVGTVDVTLTDPTRTPITLPGAWSWSADDGLVVDDVYPREASFSGGTPIVLSGEGLEPGTQVFFGDREAPDVQVQSAASMQVILPPALTAGAVDIRIVSPSGAERVLSGGFSYLPVFNQSGQAPAGVALPWVVGAISTAYDTITVTFSEPMQRAGAENPDNYAVYGHQFESSFLTVVSASLSTDGRQVELTTLAQSEMDYTIVVAGVLSTAGESLAPSDPFVSYNIAEFGGSPESGVPTDTDGDGVSDADEQRGLAVEIHYANGTVQPMSFSSDPTRADTDGDGVSDGDEYAEQSSPRSHDTDLDELSDLDELRYLASPIHQDTDGDGLPDGDEVHTFITAPTLADTDGDGYDDFDEIVVRNRLPRIADMPQPTMTVGQIDLQVDVRYSYTDATGTSRTSDRSFETSLTNSSEVSQSSSTSQTYAASFESTASASRTVGAEAGYSDGSISATSSDSVSMGFSATAGFNSEVGFASEQSSASSSSKTSNAISSFSSTVDSTSEVNEETLGASVTTDISFGTASDVAFTIENIELSLLRRDPDDRAILIPVATLSPSNPDLSITLGPAVPERGPFIFSNNEVYPSVVKEMLADPNGMVVRIANFDILDEDGRNLAFVSQDVVERTAEIVIDFGDGRSETYNVAATNGFEPGTRDPVGLTVDQALLAIGLMRNDASIGTGVAPPSWADESFGVRNNQLYRVRETWNLPLGTPISPSIPDVDNTCPRPPGVGAGVSMSKRMRSEQFRSWQVFHDDDALEITTFDNLVFTPGHAYLMAYTTDADGDGLFAIEETRQGASDLDVDTDNDCLSDWEEIRGMQLQLPITQVGTKVQIERDSLVVTDARPTGYRATSRPNSADSDGDCIRDDFEVTFADATRSFDDGNPTTRDGYLSEVPRALRQSLDPLSADTDRDGLSDGLEILGWSRSPSTTITREDEPIAPLAGGNFMVYQDGETEIYTAALEETTNTVCPMHVANLPAAPTSTLNVVNGTLRTNPWANDSDLDGLPDGREAGLGTNPLVPDLDGVLDEDADGLVAIEEIACPGTQLEPEEDPDTDNDGLPDYIEVRALGTNPCLADSDGDGLSDLVEWNGELDPFFEDQCERFQNCLVPTLSDQATGTDPLDRDTDGDGLSDGDELTGWVVVLTGAGDTVGESLLATSDPLDADSDNDGLLDSVERDGCTGPRAPYASCVDIVPPGLNPNEPDTDSDGTSDFDEIFLDDGTGHRVLDKRCNPLRRDPLTPDVVVDLRLFETFDLEGGTRWRHNGVGGLELGPLRSGSMEINVVPTFGEAEHFVDHHSMENWTRHRPGYVHRPGEIMPDDYTAFFHGCAQPNIRFQTQAAWKLGPHYGYEGDSTHRAVLPVGDSLTLDGHFSHILPSFQDAPRCFEDGGLYLSRWHVTGEQFTVEDVGTGQEWRTITSDGGEVLLTDQGQGSSVAISSPKVGIRFLFSKYAGSTVPTVPAGDIYFNGATCQNPPALPVPGDADRDGHFTPLYGGADCNDNDPSIHPGAFEACNGIDDNCNGAVDDGAPRVTYYNDFDGDGVGSGPALQACTAPPGTALTGGDCNDGNPSIRPGAPEVCNGIDDNCNGASDEGIPENTYFTDADGDGFGAGPASRSCFPPPAGTAPNGDDCVDTNPSINPNAAEICDGIDQDCTGVADDGPDSDGDGTPDVCDACPSTAAAPGQEFTCPGTSCNQLRLDGHAMGDGLYWLDPVGSFPVLAQCDMTTDGGGWTKVLGYEVTNDSFATLDANTTVQDGMGAARDGNGHVSPDGLAQLRTSSPFTEMRLECSKPTVGRTFHIKTGDGPVLDWLTGTTTTLPAAPGSYTTLPGDNSLMAASPTEWGHEASTVRVGKWGTDIVRSTPLPDRLTDHTAFISLNSHWLLDGTTRQECDDYDIAGTNLNGSWSIWVR